MAQTINNLHIEQQEQSTVVVHAFNGLPLPSWWGRKKGNFGKCSVKKKSTHCYSQCSFWFTVYDKSRITVLFKTI